MIESGLRLAKDYKTSILNQFDGVLIAYALISL